MIVTSEIVYSSIFLDQVYCIKLSLLGYFETISSLKRKNFMFTNSSWSEVCPKIHQSGSLIHHLFLSRSMMVHYPRQIHRPLSPIFSHSPHTRFTLPFNWPSVISHLSYTSFTHSRSSLMTRGLILHPTVILFNYWLSRHLWANQ